MGYDPARIAYLTPRQVVVFITSRYRSDHEAWRNAGLVSITLRRLHGDKHANFDKLFPPWGHRDKSIEDRRAANMRAAKAIVARREKAQRAALERLKK